MTRGDRMVREAVLAVLVALAMPGVVSAQSPPAEGSPPPPLSQAAPSRLVWELVDDPDVAALSSSAPFYKVAAGTSGIVALAAARCGKADCIQVAWSSDGLDWAVSPDTLDGFPIDIAWGSAGFVIVASKARSSVAYVSVEGRSWQQHKIEGMTTSDGPQAVVGTSQGYLIVGCGGMDGTYACQRGKVWSSSDGRRWTAQVPREARGTGLVAAAAQPGHVIVLSVASEEPGKDSILVWDGLAWSKIRLPLLAGVPRESSLWSVAATPGGGFAILGSYYDVKGDQEQAFMLTSPDGSTWSIEPPGPQAPGSTWLELDTGGSSGPGIATLPGRLGFRKFDVEDTQFLWWTADGQRWDMSVLSLEPYGGARVEDIAQTADGDLIAVGIGAGGDPLPQIWRGSIVPSGPPAGPVGGEPSPATRPRFTSDRLAYLLAHAPDPTACARIAQKEVRSRHPEAVAAIQCTGPGAIDTVRYYLFPTSEKMAAWWAKTLGRADESGLEPASGSFEACLAGVPGETGWQAGTLTGRVDCYRESGTGSLARKQFANARWTDDTQLIGAWAVGADDDLGALFAEFAAGRTEAR